MPHEIVLFLGATFLELLKTCIHTCLKQKKINVRLIAAKERIYFMLYFMYFKTCVLHVMTHGTKIW